MMKKGYLNDSEDEGGQVEKRREKETRPPKQADKGKNRSIVSSSETTVYKNFLPEREEEEFLR